MVRIVMRSQLGNLAPVEQIVSGFSTSFGAPLTLERDVALTVRGVNLNVRFRCGGGPGRDDAFDDNGGRGYDVYIMR